MLTIGCHLSSSKGYLAMGKDASTINANTFQFFTRNPRGAKAKAINPADVSAFLDYARNHGITKKGSVQHSANTVFMGKVQSLHAN